MVISASLAGRLRNTSLSKAHALLPLFEAVVNAIQSVDEAHRSMENAKITEVLSFDRLLDMAHQRNRAFFDKLGLPVK